jgi:hypothetical protein
MDQRTSRLWDEMLDEFRALGGTADNVCLRDGPFGRGLFPCEPSKPVKVLIPESLLVDVKHIEFENDAFPIGSGAKIGVREKLFLENYQQDFSWGVCRRDIEELLQMMHDAPANLREILKTSFHAGRWLAEPTSNSIQERFLDSRIIYYKGSGVMMPIVELANHGHATRYEVECGVGLSGQFSDEVLVRYQLCDPWQIFGKWGFASDGEFFALSLHMGLNKSGLIIERNDVKLEPGRKLYFPDVAIEDKQIKFSYLMLGHKNYPRLARGNFYRIMRDAGRTDAEETFDMIQHINRMRFYKLAAASEGAAPKLGHLLRNVARFQLEAMSHNVGAREV